MVLKKIKNLWRLAGMEQAANAYNEVSLRVPADQPKPERKLATIVDLEEVDMFPKEESKEL